jgi:broad specificity phosphatase PhoE
MSKFLYIALLAFISSNAISQNKEELTTFILLRHAEKETGQNAMTTGNDQKLSEEGKKRAERITELFSQTSIAAIYSTSYERTRSTVTPLAISKSLEVMYYEPNKVEAIDKMWNEHQGKIIIVCGHSNTIPKIANYLTGTNSYKDFSDSDYGNILVITLTQKGKPASVTWLRY